MVWDKIRRLFLPVRDHPIEPRFGWIPPLPELPPEESHSAPGRLNRLEREVFRRFPDAGWFNRLGYPSPLGEIDVLILWGEKPDRTRVVAWLPKPLSFDWELTRGSRESGAAEPGRRMLESQELRKSLEEFLASQIDAKVGSNFITAEAAGEGMDAPGLGKTTGLATALAFLLSKRGQELRLSRQGPT